jgi:hypothetical protein
MPFRSPTREPPHRLSLQGSHRDVGAWRSLVARFHGVEEVARSNRVAPTRFEPVNLHKT